VTERSAESPVKALRGPTLPFSDDPFRDGLEHAMMHDPDVIVAVQDGFIVQFGPADGIRRLLPPGIEIRD
jgi:hypothetical protein